MEDIKFNITKDLVFFDIEATGLNVVKDRIVQIALIKFLFSEMERLNLLRQVVVRLAQLPWLMLM